MKKLICIISTCLLLVGALSFTVFADTVSWNFTKNYYANVNDSFYMYYGPQQYDADHCYASAEISVSNDMAAYPRADIWGVNGSYNFEVNQNEHSDDGYVKTNAAFVNFGYAKKVQYYGERWFKNTRVDTWGRTLN